MNLFYIVLFLLFWWLLTQLLDIRVMEVLKKQSFFRKTSNYDRFVSYLIELNYSKNIPKYKFFSEITEVLVGFRRSHGVDIRPALKDLRKAGRMDFSQGKKIQSELSGFIFQYLFICVFTWYFAFELQRTIGFYFESVLLAGIAAWQFIGIIVGCILFFSLKAQMFNSFYEYFYSLYLFKSFLQISRPLSEVVETAKIKDLPENKKFKTTKRRLEHLVRIIKVEGRVPDSEVEDTLFELWDLYEIQMENFKNILIGLKLAIIVCFVLTSFLAIVFLSIGKLAI